MENFNANAYAQVIAKSWADESFRKALLADPKKVLNDSGVYIPPSVNVSIKEGRGTSTLELLLPPKPEGIDINTLHHVIDPNGCCSC